MHHTERLLAFLLSIDPCYSCDYLLLIVVRSLWAELVRASPRSDLQLHMGIGEKTRNLLTYTAQTLVLTLLGDRDILRVQMILGSSMVEHPAVNRVVAGSSPARGAKQDSWEPPGVFLYLRLSCVVFRLPHAVYPHYWRRTAWGKSRR